MSDGCASGLAPNPALASPSPHDALTLAEAIYPSRFIKYVRGYVVIHEWAAFSTFIPHPDGPHEMGESVDSAAFMAWLRALLAPPEMVSDYNKEDGSILDQAVEQQNAWYSKRTAH